MHYAWPKIAGATLLPILGCAVFLLVRQSILAPVERSVMINGEERSQAGAEKITPASPSHDTTVSTPAPPHPIKPTATVHIHPSIADAAHDQIKQRRMFGAALKSYYRHLKKRHYDNDCFTEADAARLKNAEATLSGPLSGDAVGWDKAAGTIANPEAIVGDDAMKNAAIKRQNAWERVVRDQERKRKDMEAEWETTGKQKWAQIRRHFEYDDGDDGAVADPDNVVARARRAFRPAPAQAAECARWIAAAWAEAEKADADAASGAAPPDLRNFPLPNKLPNRGLPAQYQQDYELFLLVFRHLYMTGRRRPRPTYVELAAFHPRCHSNSYFLDVCLGWQGICIEADPLKIVDFRRPRGGDKDKGRWRRGCHVVHACVSDRDGKVIHFGSSAEHGTSADLSKPQPVNFLRNTISDRTHCIAQLRLGSSFLLSVLRFLDRTRTSA